MPPVPTLVQWITLLIGFATGGIIGVAGAYLAMRNPWKRDPDDPE